MAIPRRLNSGNRFERSQNRDVKRVVFLSVEGNVTEPQYFGYVKAFQKELGIKSVVELHVLQRQDTSSSPFKVLELLENYLEIRNNSNFSSEIDKLDFKNYTKEFIQNYLDDKGSLPQKEVRKFEALLREQQLDLAYLYFLNKFKGSDNGAHDVFGLVLDRDATNHSPQSLSSLFQQCDEKGYQCFMTTPRFEFWLLLHVSDVATEYADELSKMLDPSDKSVNIHLLEKTGTNKKIHQKTFEQYFLPNIDNAIERASSFCTQRDDLLNQLGSNLGELFSILRD